jgi:hypothetical protein
MTLNVVLLLSKSTGQRGQSETHASLIVRQTDLALFTADPTWRDHL